MSVKPDTVVTTSRREANKQQKRDRIITAARALFHSQGYKKTTTQQIAQAAQVAAGTVFLYARSKEDLLLLVFYEEFIELITAATDRLEDKQPVADQVLDLFSALSGYHAHDLELARELMKVITFISDPERRGDVREIHYAIERKLVRIISNAQDTGELGETADPLLIARTLFGAFYQRQLLWLGGYFEKDQCDAELDELVHAILAPAYCNVT